MIYRDEPVQEIRASSRKVKKGKEKNGLRRMKKPIFAMQAKFSVLSQIWKNLTKIKLDSKKCSIRPPANFRPTN